MAKLASTGKRVVRGANNLNYQSNEIIKGGNTMSTYNTTVTVDVLRGKASTLDHVIGTYTGSVTSLYQLTEELNRMWDGGASQAFQTKFNGQKEQFEKGARTLRDFTQALRDAADLYVRTDNEAACIVIR